jgi:putative transposase
MIDGCHKNRKITAQIVKETIRIYNDFRLHYSNYMLTPNQMHCPIKRK